MNYLIINIQIVIFQNVQNLSSSSSDFGNEFSNLTNGPDPLPTLHEDMELIMNPPVHLSHASGKHTKNIEGCLSN